MYFVNVKMSERLSASGSIAMGKTTMGGDELPVMRCASANGARVCPPLKQRQVHEVWTSSCLTVEPWH